MPTDLDLLVDFKRALDHAAIVAITDVRGRVTYVNDKFCEISGYSRDELVGQDHRIINSGYHSKEFIRQLWVTIARGRVWQGELRNRAKNGQFYWVDTTIVPFLDDRGRPYQYIAIRADITARKAAEQKLAEQAALARVGQMAAVVAHEVRNPLAGIKGAIQVLMSRRPPNDADVPVMRDITERIDDLSGLIDGLMDFARPSTPVRQSVDLAGLIHEAVTALKRDPIAQGTTITIAGAESIPAELDPTTIRAALLNILLNAAQAVAGKGTIHVTVAADNGNGIVEIRDTGPGIPIEIRDKVFEPFFTTKARGGGLGLAVARRTAETHGGTVTLAAPRDGGTQVTFTVRLRADHAAPAGA
jgi:PAS domain S-box-containing protein